MIRYNIILIVLLCLACIAQQFVPAISGLLDVRIMIVQIVFLCSSLTGGTSMMLLLAFLGGFFWDCQHTLGGNTGDASVYSEPVGVIKFGYSIILFSLMGAAVLGVRPLFRSGKWYIPALVAGFSIYCYLWVEYLLINVIRGEFTVNWGVFSKVTLTAFLSTLLAPGLLYLLSQFALLCNHTIKNDNRRRFFPTKDRV